MNAATREVNITNEATQQVVSLVLAITGSPLADQLTVQAALDSQFGYGIWDWWDARMPEGQWVTTSEL